MVAEVNVICTAHWGDPVRHTAYYETVEAAKAEYDRVADYVSRRVERKNDLPKLLTVEGVDTHFTVPIDDIHSVNWIDYAKSNAMRVGLVDAYPNVFGRR